MDIPPEVIAKRYINGIKNLFDIYMPIVDGALIFANSEGKHQLIAKKTTLIMSKLLTNLGIIN